MYLVVSSKYYEFLFPSIHYYIYMPFSSSWRSFNYNFMSSANVLYVDFNLFVHPTYITFAEVPWPNRSFSSIYEIHEYNDNALRLRAESCALPRLQALPHGSLRRPPFPPAGARADDHHCRDSARLPVAPASHRHARVL